MAMVLGRRYPSKVCKGRGGRFRGVCTLYTHSTGAADVGDDKAALPSDDARAMVWRLGTRLIAGEGHARQGPGRHDQTAWRSTCGTVEWLRRRKHAWKRLLWCLPGL